jgi:hypothetical protein
MKTISAPKRDWHRFLTTLPSHLFRESESMYFEIVLQDGQTERVYSDSSLVRYRTLLLFLSENNRMSIVQ